MVRCADQIPAVQRVEFAALVVGLIDGNVNHKLTLGKVVVILG